MNKTIRISLLVILAFCSQFNLSSGFECRQPTITHGFYKTTKHPVDGLFPLDTILIFACNDGYYLKGSNKIQCQEHGRWSSKIPICLKACIAPNADHFNLKPYDKQYYAFGQKIEYTCQDGHYVPVNIDYRDATCKLDGTWDYSPYKCYKYCPNPSKFLKGRFTPVKKAYIYEEIVYYSCPKSKVKYTYAACNKEGLWIQASFCYDSCKAISVEHGSYSPVYKAYKFGDKLSYVCNEHYYSSYEEKYDFTVCQKNGHWNYRPPVCRKYCVAPSSSKYYYQAYEKTLYKSGEKIDYLCDHGYYAPSDIDYSSATCGHDGSWSNNPFVCNKYCPARNIEHGSYKPVQKVYKYNEKIAYECTKGYYLQYHGDVYDYNTCLKTGIWSYQPPICKKFCVAPDHLHYNYKPYEKLYYKFGEKIAYKCDNGYYAPSHIDYEYATCGEHGEWNRNPFACYKYCFPRDIEHGLYKPIQKVYKYDEKLKYECVEGYYLQYETSAYDYNVCLKSGLWSLQLPKCKKYCTAPIVSHYNYKPYEQLHYKFGEKIHYECDSGFYAPAHIDYKYAVCGLDGKWSHDPFVCYRYCFAPRNYKLGIYHPSKIVFVEKEKIVLTCARGFRLNGKHNFALCDKEGKWRTTIPQCIRH